jgi:two-component sensor histidine kinase
VTTPGEIAERYTELDPDGLARLQRLLGVWSVLADLSFSDLLLLTPVRKSGGTHLVILGQIRPATSATLLRADLVGQMLAVEDWPLAAAALKGGVRTEGVAPVPISAPLTRIGSSLGDTGELPAVPDLAQVECIPIRLEGVPVAVMVRVGALQELRRPGRLEREYGDVYDRLARMVAAGIFPPPGEDMVVEDTPRVGDGLVVVDADARIRFASPNAMSALHRMGVNTAVEGARLTGLGIEEVAIDRALGSGHPVIEEVERRPDVIVLLHCIPLIDQGTVTGALVLLRDVTDLRRLDRLLLSKDAAIREVHHRVKNNLQTISSLLRLQARRLDLGAGREALQEAERRVRSMAVVHEILSREPGDEVPFDEIVDVLVRMAQDSIVSGQSIEFRVTGDIGELSADIATPLALSLAELLQNAVEHAFGTPEGIGTSDSLWSTLLDTQAPHHDVSPVGHVEVILSHEGGHLTLQVRDDGRGLPAGFDIAHTSSLGLLIVRDLVTSQLGGTIRMESDAGTVVTIEVPLRGVGSDTERTL